MASTSPPKLVQHARHVDAAPAGIGVLLVHADLVRRHHRVRIGGEVERGIQRQRDETWLHGDPRLALLPHHLVDPHQCLLTHMVCRCAAMAEPTMTTTTGRDRGSHDLTPAVDLTLHHGAGPFRTRLPHYVALLSRPAITPARPARTSRPGWRWRRPAITAGPGRRWWRTIRCRRRMAGSAITRAKPPATARELDAAVSIHAVERFLGDMATRGRLDRSRRRPPPASASWWSAPARAACRPPITWPGSAIRSRSTRPARCPAACCISASPPTACRAPTCWRRSPASSAWACASC